jgi:hypothetical protein
MIAGTLFYRVVTRKLQGAGSSIQFILLGGFESTLTTAKASYFETLSPGHVLQQSEIDLKVAAMKKHANAAETRDVTDNTVAKKLAKLWDNGNTSASAPAGLQLFGEMRIGQYL